MAAELSDGGIRRIRHKIVTMIASKALLAGLQELQRTEAVKN